jgi:hypothetical protein
MQFDLCLYKKKHKGLSGLAPMDYPNSNEKFTVVPIRLGMAIDFATMRTMATHRKEKPCICKNAPADWHRPNHSTKKENTKFPF